jgi:hypothetical protein
MAKRSLAGMMALAPKAEAKVEPSPASLKEAPTLLDSVAEQSPVEESQLEVAAGPASQPLPSEPPAAEPQVSQERVATVIEAAADELPPAATSTEAEGVSVEASASDFAVTTGDATPASAPRASRTAPKAKRATGGAMYARLEAKEARLRPDQRDELGVLARRLERTRQQARREHATERITDNTLIRVAIDVLLQAGVEGLTENELRESLQSKVTG